MTPRNEEEIRLVNDELDDLDRQVSEGDLDETTAESLRVRYIAELGRLTTKSDNPAADVPDTPSSGRRRVSGRALAGTTIVVVAIAVIGVFAVTSLTGPSTAGTEGVVASVIRGGGPGDLASVSNEEMEEVVAANPDVVGMRLALARRYFEAGEFDRALDHYMVVLESEKHPEALANVGWMTYISGRPDVALGYVEAALQRQPSSITATWFLGNIQFTLGNYDEAAIALATITEAEGVPDDVKQSAESLLVEIGEQ